MRLTSRKWMHHQVTKAHMGKTMIGDSPRALCQWRWSSYAALCCRALFTGKRTETLIPMARVSC